MLEATATSDRTLASWRRPLALPVLVALLSGCDSRGDVVHIPSRTVVGDTTIVVAGDPVWGDSVVLVEEMSFGVVDGDPRYEFGSVDYIAVDEAGGTYVFDGQVPALRYYDATGSYVRSFGGEGEGPGEYRNTVLGLRVRSADGRVVLRDPRNGRITVYDPDGWVHETWSIESGLFTTRALIVDTADYLYLKIRVGEIVEGRPWPIGLLQIDPDGAVVDTLTPPTLLSEPVAAYGTFGTRKHWDYSPFGGFWVGVNDSYRIEHWRVDGSMLRVIRDLDPVEFEPEERDEHVAYNDWLGRLDDRELPAMPRVKPYYSSVVAAEDGRLWVRRFVAARKGESETLTPPPGVEPPPTRSWHEPSVSDVFEPDGTFLGTVRLPPNVSSRVQRGDHVWGVRRDDLGVQEVVRYRITPVR